MPELPEVETTRRGIAPLLEGQRITAIKVRERRLRWPVPGQLEQLAAERRVTEVTRRAKYLLLHLDDGNCILLHLGMSGSLRVLPERTTPSRHDHVDIVFGEQCLRLRDPRRFGAVLWCSQPPHTHPLLVDLGPEPLSDEFDGKYLHRIARHRRLAIKQLLMNGRIVVGVGNIYANEALFGAGINPSRAANRISRARCNRLSDEVKQVLARAIAEGGTTLRDFRREDGRPGYFRIQLNVYGRGGQPCVSCGRPLTETRLGQRSTVYCARCQR